MRQLESVLADIPLLKGIDPETLSLIAGCAKNVRFDEGSKPIRRGDAADTFYLIRHGSVVLETYVPGRGAVAIETLEPGSCSAGHGCLPRTAGISTRVRSHRERDRFRRGLYPGQVPEDPALGYDLVSRFAQVLIERLQWTRLDSSTCMGPRSR